MKKIAVSMLIRTVCIVGTLSMACTPILAASSGPQTPGKETPVRGGILKVLNVKDASSFGYPPEIAGAQRNYAPPFFDHLLTIGEGDVYQPELATSWKPSADGKSITFQLRRGVKFHDGTDFNAQAVKFNLDKLIAEQILPGVTSVDVVDPYTVRLNCPKYDNLILYNLASNYNCYMYSPTAFQKNGMDWATTHPVGTGPFKLQGEYQRGGTLKLVRNPDYWAKGLPYLDGMEIAAVAEEISKITALKAGKANVLYDSPPATIADLRDAGYTARVAGGSIMFMTFDIKNNKTFADKRVRQAIEYAIDKEGLAKGPGLNIYKSAYQIVLDSSRSYNKSCPPRKYDPAKAKQLLAEAGYPNGFAFKFFYQTDTWRDGVIGVQNDLAKVGIKMDAQPISAAAYVKIRLQGEVEPGSGCQMNTAIYGDSLFTIDYFWRTNSNEFHHVLKPAGIDALIEKARSAKDDATKVRLTQDIVKLIYDDVTAVPVWVTARGAILDKSVQNDQFFINGDPLNNRYDKVWLKN